MRRVRIRVIGKVQGVFFRLYTKKKAESIDLTGWVMNEVDGTVTLEAQGENQNIEQLISWCHQGSPWANVLRVEVKELELSENEKGYKVK